MTRTAKATPAQRKQADEINGIVVQHLDGGEITVVDRHELDYPARAQRVLYTSPDPTDEAAS